MTVLTAAEIWRDYDTDGVPASGFHHPVKRDVKTWGEMLEAMIQGNGLGFATLALLNADLNHGANSLAMVYGDSTAANNGTYQKSGSSGSGSWSRVADLPGSIVNLTVTGGTANAVTTTSIENPQQPGAKLYLFTPTSTNTGGAYTINNNGTGATPVKNAFGADPAANAFLIGTQVLLAWQSTHYQALISASVDASAILADAQAAAAAAAASAADAASVWFGTRALAEAATVGASVPVIVLAGYATRGDAPIAYFIRVASEPSHPGKLQSFDGAWWEIQGPFVYPEQFGAAHDGVTDDLAAFMDAEDARFALNAELRFQPGNYYLNNPNSWTVLRPRWQGGLNNSTVITMDGSSTACVLLTGAGGYTSGYIRDVTFWAPVTRTTGEALRLEGDATFQPDEFEAHSLKITGSGSWDIPLYLYGRARASPQGLRAVYLCNLFIGRDTSAGIYADCCVGLRIEGGGIYGGVSNSLQTAGDAGSSKACTDVQVTGFKINGVLNADDTISSVFSAVMASLALGSDASNNTVMGFNSGATANNGTGNNLAALG